MEAHGKSWDEYWRDSAQDRSLFAVIAKLYRRFLISPAVRHYFRKYFRDEPGRRYLHAGCGSAESDRRIGFTRASLVLMDISREALLIAKRESKAPNVHLVCGDIFRPPFREASFDGVWNLGVMEHFDPNQAAEILAEFRRVLRPGHVAILFWPPNFGSSRWILAPIERLLTWRRGRTFRFFPDEVNRLRSRGHALAIMKAADLEPIAADFTFRDCFIHLVAVGRKPSV